MDITTQSKIKRMRGNYLSVAEMLPHLPDMTEAKLRAHLIDTYGSSARLHREWTEYELSVLDQYPKLTPWQLVSRGLLDRDNHEVLTKLLELKKYEWILPKRTKEEVEIHLGAATLYHHCFPYNLIEIDSGLSITTVVGSYKQFKKYIPYFKTGKPRHQSGIEKRIQSYTNKKPLF